MRPQLHTQGASHKALNGTAQNAAFRRHRKLSLLFPRALAQLMLPMEEGDIAHLPRAVVIQQLHQGVQLRARGAGSTLRPRCAMPTEVARVTVGAQRTSALEIFCNLDARIASAAGLGTARPPVKQRAATSASEVARAMLLSQPRRTGRDLKLRANVLEGQYLSDK
eukprot:SAG25_NODE_6722_length_535_cov_0.756881_1_plen_166_part_00